MRWIAVVIAVGILSTGCIGEATVAGAAERPVLDILREKATCIKEICNGQLITFTMLARGYMVVPEKVDVTKEVSVLWQDGTLYIKAISMYAKPPAYTPREQPPYGETGDMREGEQIVWRNTENYAIWSSTRNDHVSVVKGFSVKPDGSVRKTGETSIKSIYRAGSRDAMQDYTWFEMAMGRSGHHELRKIIRTDKAASTGMIHLVADGSMGGGPGGEWSMQVDGNCDYLIREAILRKDPNRPPIARTECSGTTEASGRIVCAASGSMTLDDTIGVLYDAHYQNVNILKVSDKEREAFKQEILDQVTAPCSSTHDFRGEKPVVTSTDSTSCR